MTTEQKPVSIEKLRRALSIDALEVIALLDLIEKMAGALGFYADEKQYEPTLVYRGEPMSEAYQIEVIPIVEGERHRVAQKALAEYERMK